MTTYTFTVQQGMTLLQLNKQSLERCFDRIAIVRSSGVELEKIVLTVTGGKTITIEQEPEHAQR